MIDFSKLGSRNAAGNNGSSASGRQDLPKAQFWLNVGYYCDAPTTEDPQAQRFVSLPVGIALDTMEPVRISGQNRDFNAFQSARNELHQLILAEAEKLEPGQDEILNLQIQIRRVNGEPVVDSANNPYGLAPTNKLIG